MIYLTIAALAIFLLPVGGDFQYFYHAAQAVARGVSPYTVPGFYSPIHAALLYVPLTAFDMDTAFRVHGVLSLTVFMLALRRWSSARVMVLLLASPSLWTSAQYGNLEFWPVLALLLPTQAALLAALVKPQIGFVLVVWLAWREYKSGGWQSAVKAVAPAALVVGVSLWQGMHFGDVTAQPWNTSLWPLSMLPGIVLAVAALIKGVPALALAAGPLLSPYVNGMSWVALLPAAAKSMRWAALVVSFQWLVFLVLTRRLYP